MIYTGLENANPVRQAYPTRNPTPLAGASSEPTWAVGVHTVEIILDRIAPDLGAEKTAGYINIRTDKGSYIRILDLDSVVCVFPDDYTSFSVAQSGYNSRTWNLALACRVSDLDKNDPLTRLLIATAGKEIAAFWKRKNVDIAKAAYWGGTDALKRPCLFNHGDVQPGDRTDAWAKHPHRATFDAWLVHDILWHAGLVDTPEPAEEEEEMKSYIAWDPRTGRGWHIFGNTKVWLANGDQVNALLKRGVEEIQGADPAWIDACATLNRNAGGLE